MRTARLGLYVGLYMGLGSMLSGPRAHWGSAQEPRPPETETLHSTTQLVVLDATVFDKSGHPVTVPLGRDDFQIEENRKPQTIRYFESAMEHEGGPTAGTAEKRPLLIAVLDELNYPYNPAETNAINIQNQSADYLYMRNELVGFLKQQPEQMNEPMEVLALTHHGFLIVARPTRARDTLLERVRQRDPGLGSPYRDYLEEADGTQTVGSLQAMWSLALEERSLPGRKLVLWLGYGGPDLGVAPVLMRPHRLTPFERYQREVTDLLVDARITVDLFRPGLEDGRPEVDASRGAQLQSALERISNPSDIGFVGYVQATGGVLRRGNDVNGEVTQAVNYGTAYYTLSYSPTSHSFDGDFRRIRVIVKGHPDWVVLTKVGYYALQYGGEKDELHQVQADLSVATYEAMPFSAIGVNIEQAGREEGTEEKGGFTAKFMLSIDPVDLQWHTDAQKNIREADVAVSAAALGPVTAQNALASKAGTWKLTTTANVDDPAHVRTNVTLELRVPAKTLRLRFVVRDLTNGRMGTTDVAMKAVEAAPGIQQSAPGLQPRPAGN
jgi:VWFA-related protein